jgi:hypothetical protein
LDFVATNLPTPKKGSSTGSGEATAHWTMAVPENGANPPRVALEEPKPVKGEDEQCAIPRRDQRKDDGDLDARREDDGGAFHR